MLFPQYTLENRATIMQPAGDDEQGDSITVSSLMNSTEAVADNFSGFNASLQSVLDQTNQIVPSFRR